MERIIDMIYADNAATTQIDKDAFEAMIPFLTNEYGNASQPYSFATREKKVLKDARKIIAECINADPEEIYFTSGGTESDNWAIKMGNRIRGGNVVTSEIEHHAVLNACDAIKKDGVEIKYLSVDRTGVIDIDNARNIIDKNTGLVSVMMANNEIGSIQPIKELSKMARDKGAIFHTDAVQAVGHIPIDVKDLNVDLLSASGHKFNGPKGIGFLYVKKGVNIDPYMNGGAQEKRMRAGTENVASIVAMAVALRNNIQSMEEHKLKLKKYENMILESISNSNIDFIVNGNENKIPGNISISFRNMEGEVILHRMDIMGISISTGSACDSVNTQISHVIKAINVPDDFAEGTIRISLGKYNNIDEVKLLVASLIKVVKN